MIDLMNDYSNNSLKLKKDIESMTTWIIDNKCSIRQAAENLGISKSSVHYRIHTYVKRYYNEEYQQIVRILRYNKMYRSKPRRSWGKYGM